MVRDGVRPGAEYVQLCTHTRSWKRGGTSVAARAAGPRLPLPAVELARTVPAGEPRRVAVRPAGDREKEDVRGDRPRDGSSRPTGATRRSRRCVGRSTPRASRTSTTSSSRSPAGSWARACPAPHWESIAQQGLPARLRRDRQPLRRPPRRVHRLRPGGRRARRHPGARDLHAAALGSQGRARLLHLLPRPRGSRGRRPRSSRADCRGNLKRDPGRVRGADRHAPARRPRARDDVAQAERRRHARRSRACRSPTATTSTSSRSSSRSSTR